MDPEIHFGEVEHTPPTTRLRPDRNGQFATVAVYGPRAGDLPIFVEMDVMREMLAHAHSDRRVELGGVLLGAQSADEDGQPFVVVTDCLRARHYESTKGSFKFTHDTWEQITREREQLPTDLQMVGWYHTHPDWGVFLSGLDMFICDNFFNKPLDVALVIDPCQLDTGFFQWTNQPEQRIRRTGGYTIFASRFRADALRDLATELEDQVMPESARSVNSPVSVHMLPAPPPPAWQTLSVLGMFGMQFCVLLLLAIRLLPATYSDTDSSAREVAAIQENADRLDLVRQREATVDAKMELLETIARREGNLPEGIVKSLSERTSEVDQLRGSLRGQQSLAKEMDAKVAGLETALTDIRRSDERSRAEMASLHKELDKLHSDLRAAREQLAGAGKTPSTTAEREKTSWWSMWWADGKSLGFGVFLGAAAVGATVVLVLRRRSLIDPDRKPTDSVHNIDDG